MILNPAFAAIVLGLISAGLWGAGDFSGGLATRRSPVSGVVICSQIVGLSLMIVLALLRAEPIPSTGDLLWGCLGGIAGMIGLTNFYHALSVGQMGVVAPVAAVFTAILPVIVGAITQGLPSSVQMIGFGLALIGVWFLSRPATANAIDNVESSPRQSQGIGLAILAGIGFGGFLIFLHQASTTAVFWPLAAARLSSITALLIITLSRKQVWRPARQFLPLIAAAGILDVLGNTFYILAAQAGRMDIASVLSSLYPASTVLLASLILKERVTRLQGAGIVAALLAIMLITA